jgi:hypothetical protein
MSRILSLQDSDNTENHTRGCGKAVPYGTMMLLLLVTDWNDRLRKLKCDATKPECQRCLAYYGPHSDRRCGGYKACPKPPKKAPSPARRRLPLSTTASIPLRPLLLRPRMVCHHTDSLSHSLSTLRFTDSRQARYFHHFYENIVIDLAAGFDPTLWNHVILLACHTEQCLRDAVVAIAALSIAMQKQSAAADLECTIGSISNDIP